MLTKLQGFANLKQRFTKLEIKIKRTSHTTLDNHGVAWWSLAIIERTNWNERWLLRRWPPSCKLLHETLNCKCRCGTLDHVGQCTWMRHLFCYVAVVAYRSIADSILQQSLGCNMQQRIAKATYGYKNTCDKHDDLWLGIQPRSRP